MVTDSFILVLLFFSYSSGSGAESWIFLFYFIFLLARLCLKISHKCSIVFGCINTSYL